MAEQSTLSASQLFNVDGIVAVITGGGSGIGRMIARALATNGAKAVYIIGRRFQVLEDAASTGAPGVIIPVQGDVTSKQSLSAIVERITRDQGYINVLVANSGINGPPHYADLPADRKPSVSEFRHAMWQPAMEDFTTTFHVNCTAVFYTAVAFLELLDAGNARQTHAQKSQILVMSSGAAFNRHVAAGFSYSMSKAAVHQLSLMLATYFLPYHIRVNNLLPGIYPSDITASRLPKDKIPWEEGAVPPETCPLTRSGSEQDMAGAALFLISNAGAYVNGGSLLTDGGRLSI